MRGDMVEKKIDILKHVLVPKHQVLSEKEKLQVLEEYNISPIQLPVIKSKDPIVKAINAKIGDIIMIIRKGPSGEYKYYRRVAD
jgi:DNA-directed RNA polymerase subunit H